MSKQLRNEQVAILSQIQKEKRELESSKERMKALANETLEIWTFLDTSSHPSINDLHDVTNKFPNRAPYL